MLSPFQPLFFHSRHSLSPRSHHFIFAASVTKSLQSSSYVNNIDFLLQLSSPAMLLPANIIIVRVLLALLQLLSSTLAAQSLVSFHHQPQGTLHEDQGIQEFYCRISKCGGIKSARW
ncbi:uncharacterized protein LOC114760886 [Neltuma alba]|uniref:uncharacterized protein LOC114760886 n=1 Tax=Neltuma alba TaxID=207710 RepID=UPI0010A2F6D7|nr:uncharacterized protein LOC114760886 [Prosopis alba]